MTTTLDDLLNGRSFERPKGTPPLERARAEELVVLVDDWALADDGKSIAKKLRTGGFSEAAALLVKIAALADENDHHPDVRIWGYRWLELTFTTHSIGGLSDNDFILAAKIDRLVG